jgi:excisionase family DNA binding protein
VRVGTPQDVADLLRVHVNTVYRYAQEGKLPTLRKIGPRLRFDLDAVEAWMKRGQS